MIRSLNVIALLALIGSAIAAYSVKYETILASERLKARESELQREKDAIAILKAEWQLLNRPSRLQALAPPESGMQVLNVRQLAHAADLPQAKPEGDKIALMLDGVITGSVPDASSKAVAKTPDPATKTLVVTPTERPKPARATLKSANPHPPAPGAPLTLQRPTTTPGAPMPLKAVGPAPAAKSTATITGAKAAPENDAIAEMIGASTPKASGPTLLRPLHPVQGTGKETSKAAGMQP